MKGRLLFILVVSLLAVSCEGWLCPDKKNHFDRVMILYSAGCNTLSNELETNVKELKSGYIPGKKDKKALVVISHRANGFKNGRPVYEPATDSYIIRFYKYKNNVVADTLKTVEAGKYLSQPSVMKEVLGYVRDNFKSDHYGMIFSSHATGWLPQGYYLNPVSGSSGGSASSSLAPRRLPDLPEGALPYVEREYQEGLPRLKSIGEEDAAHNGITVKYEMDVLDFRASIPMHLDYIVFDACFMGCIEVAYELRDICDKIAFSPTEILETGFQYETIAGQLLEGNNDLYSACKDYFDKYDKKTDPLWRSATVTLIDCSKLEKVATVCNGLISRYRDGLAAINPSQVQPYFQKNKHWFYDLEDVFLKAGITDTEKRNLEQALDGCVIYKAATPTFYIGGYVTSGFEINIYSGFSMYLPCNGSPYLDDFYKSFAWNKATGLVQ